ncbi:MAG: hypothetical protein ACAI38_04755 [Myxococcota bacterium]|nr:hypothetical protein [Myxococcota bacterium]
MKLVALLVAFAAGDAPLPGKLGNLRYFVSPDDASHVYLVDWNVDGRDLALVLLSDRVSAEADKVVVHERRDRSGSHVIYTAGRDVSALAFTDGDGRIMYEGTARKQWTLTDSAAGKEQVTRYVEIPPPPGTRTAAQLVDLYVKTEGAGRNIELGTAPADIEKAVNGACGGKVAVKANDAAKAGMVERARVAGQAIANLCLSDSDYKVAVAKLDDLKFSASGKADTAIARKGKTLEIAFGSTPVNTPATVTLWLKNNL